MKRLPIIWTFAMLVAGFLVVFIMFSEKNNLASQEKGGEMTQRIHKTDAQWKEELTPEQYEITREKGTEKPFTGKYYDFYEKGVYRCCNCGNLLFDSSAKFHSGSGWPSFYEASKVGSIDEKLDLSSGLIRTEVICNKCGAHLGHVFNDGPDPTGLRYCINSAALEFEEVDEDNKKQESPK